MDLFSLLDHLVASSTVTIDRKRGHPHPRIPKVIYPLDGGLNNTLSTDGADIDVFVGRAHGRGVVGALLTADLCKRDIEIEVLLDCTPSDVQLARRF